MCLVEVKEAMGRNEEVSEKRKKEQRMTEGPRGPLLCKIESESTRRQRQRR